MITYLIQILVGVSSFLLAAIVLAFVNSSPEGVHPPGKRGPVLSSLILQVLIEFHVLSCNVRTMTCMSSNVRIVSSPVEQMHHIWQSHSLHHSLVDVENMSKKRHKTLRVNSERLKYV